MSELELGTSHQGTRTETNHRTTTTFLDLLRRQMSGSDRTRRKRTLKERLRFKCIGCYGRLRLTNRTALNRPSSPREDEIENQSETESDLGSGLGTMNLAATLQADRYNSRGGESMEEEAVDMIMTPTRVSLMRLLEETVESSDVVNFDDGKETEMLTGTLTGNDTVCCVCMGRKKGAAFIPCGHTFCRVCTRELWLNRGSCPLCNRPILEILDIF